MTTTPVRPGAEPFTADAASSELVTADAASSDLGEADAASSDPVGVLLVHGFTGSPAALRPLGAALAARGRSVRVPLLPGHGTSWQDANGTGWPDWYAAVEASFDELRAGCRSVVVGGLSMGGALALRLAQHRGAEVAGLVLVNPAIASADPRLRVLPLLRRLSASAPAIGNDIAAGGDEVAYDRTPLHALWSGTRLWHEVQADLTRVTQPLLVFRSTTDHVVDTTSLALLRRWTRSPDAEWVCLSRSYHVATLDHDAPELTARTVAFVDRVTRPDVAVAGPIFEGAGRDR